jgi:DnaK suppressor protein
VNDEALRQFRRRLLDQRSSLLARWRQALSDENELFGADEWDTGVEIVGAAALASIDAQGRGALARIQSSLARIERGTYGECAACHARIDEEHLRAAPDGDRCARCAPKLN